MILLNMFQTFQINKRNFEQYLKLHKHPDTFIQKCDATTQTGYTTIRPKPFLKNLSNRMHTPLEKTNLAQYWPSNDNDSTNDELQKDPPEAIPNLNSQYKTLTYVALWSRSWIITAQHQMSGLLNTPQHSSTVLIWESLNIDHFRRLQLTTLHPFREEYQRQPHYRFFQAAPTINPAISTCT